MGEVVSERDLLARVFAERGKGHTVAMANGCFDLLHVGHVRYLAGAAEEADVLVVAINDDESVRGLKGEGRPILAAAHRAELVAALRVVVRGRLLGPTVGPLLERSARVHCKGTDYTVESVPSALSWRLRRRTASPAIRRITVRDLLARIGRRP